MQSFIWQYDEDEDNELLFCEQCGVEISEYEYFSFDHMCAGCRKKMYKEGRQRQRKKSFEYIDYDF